MSGHTVSVKWLIKLNYIVIALLVIYFPIMAHSFYGFSRYEKEQFRMALEQSEADRAQMKVDLESYPTKAYLDKTFVHTKDLMPSVFKRESRKQLIQTQRQ